MEPIRFRWTSAPRDHYDLLRSASRAIRFAPLFAAAFVIAAVVLAILGQWASAVFGVLMAIVILLVPRWQATASLRRYPLAGKEIHATADNRSLVLDVGDDARSELPWSQVHSWTDAGETIVVRTNDSAAGYPIPHRAFDDPQQLTEFTELLAREVGSPR